MKTFPPPPRLLLFIRLSSRRLFFFFFALHLRRVTPRTVCVRNKLKLSEKDDQFRVERPIEGRLGLSEKAWTRPVIMVN